MGNKTKMIQHKHPIGTNLFSIIYCKSGIVVGYSPGEKFYNIDTDTKWYWQHDEVIVIKNENEKLALMIKYG